MSTVTGSSGFLGRGPALRGAVVGLLLAGSVRAAAHPREDPTARYAERLCRVYALECVLGASDRSRLRQAERLWGEERPEVLDDPLAVGLLAELQPEREVVTGQSGWTRPAWRLQPLGLLGAGDLVPDHRAGDVEAGWLSAAAGGEGRIYPGVLELAVAAEARLGLLDGPASVAPGLPHAWAGVAWRGLVAGFGLRPRFVGPGRFGSLMLTDNGATPPLGSVAWTSPVGQRFGRVHLEAGAGWLPGERRDVQNPGWLLMDLRYLPVPMVELGLTRVGIFGGEGRPAPDIGQLLLPTDPHIYDDPDRVEPDQDEMAALDLRVTLPVGRWTGRSSRSGRVEALDAVELYWQYGGEDVIGRDLGGMPYPALAGVANLFGAEVVAGPMVVSGEGARLLDDYFRWYTGHRVYHDGFTRDGRPLAHASGGDSITWSGAVAWEQPTWGVEGSVEDRLRVGVVEALGPNLLALAADERRLRLGLRGWLRTPLGWTFGVVQVDRIRGEGFVPGADGWAWRVAVGRSSS